MYRKGRWCICITLIVFITTLIGCSKDDKTTPTSPDIGEPVGHALPGVPPYLVEKQDGTVRDAVTGLIWLRDPGCFGTLNWQAAHEAVARLEHGMCGLSDGSKAGNWRLPDVEEMLHLADYARSVPALPSGHPFVNLQVGAWYWLRTPYAPNGALAWSTFLHDGSLVGSTTGILKHVWPVKGRPSETAPVFIDNQNGTVTDLVSGLIWLKDANCFGTKNWNTAVGAIETLASGECGLTDGSQTGDWRLPEVEELRSLIDDANFGPALPAGHPFINVQSDMFSDEYWASTVYIPAPHAAWFVSLHAGSVSASDKGAPRHVWAVRGGQSL
jgi:hypothetical protein